MTLREEQVRALLEACGQTHAEEIDCEEFLEVMAAYVEAVADGKPLPESLRKAHAHEPLCASCAEECRALFDVLAAERAQSSD
jgi:hypothetical protein